jgi:hypothetical protein
MNSTPSRSGDLKIEYEAMIKKGKSTFANTNTPPSFLRSPLYLFIIRRPMVINPTTINETIIIEIKDTLGYTTSIMEDNAYSDIKSHIPPLNGLP